MMNTNLLDWNNDKCIKDGRNILNEDEQYIQTEDEELSYNYEEFQGKIDSFYN